MLEKIKFLFQAIGIMLVVMILIAATYFFSIIGAVALGVFLIYVLVSEYNKTPPNNHDRH